MWNKDSKVALLRELEVLDQCSTKQLKEIASLADLVTVEAGRVLMREGTQPSEAFVVISGEALVSREGTEVARVGAGEILGEMAILDRPTPRSASVVTAAETTLLVFHPRAFWSMLERNPAVRRRVDAVRTERRDLELAAAS